jgi:hypothetical protein
MVDDVVSDRGDRIAYIARYFWNAAAFQTWLAESALPNPVRTVMPWREEGYSFQGVEDGGPKSQALAHLLSQPQFSLGFEQG